MKSTSTIKKLLMILLIAAAAAAGWYFFYWRDTPQYAAGEIQQAVDQKDFALLQKRVDLNQVYASALDDIIDELNAHPTGKNERIAWALDNFKPQVIDALITVTQNDFEQKQDKNSNNPAARASRWIETYAGSNALSILHVVSITKENDTAVCTFTVHDKKLNHDFTWKVALQKDINGTWTAVKVLNFKEYLEERAALNK